MGGRRAPDQRGVSRLINPLNLSLPRLGPQFLVGLRVLCNYNRDEFQFAAFRASVVVNMVDAPPVSKKEDSAVPVRGHRYLSSKSKTYPNYWLWALLSLLLAGLVLVKFAQDDAGIMMGTWQPERHDSRVSTLSPMRLSLTLSTLLTIGASYAASSPPIVDLGYAKYQGSVNNKTGNLEFLGIRYAAAPTGPLRWREPRPPGSTTDVQPANVQPNMCWQGLLGGQPSSPFRRESSHTRRQESGSPQSSEDCLFLNVVMPAFGKENLPVVVWIHGGGYFGGSASLYDGNDLTPQAGGNVVSVVIQYRLGVFGFLSGQKIHDGGVLNAGLLDQQFALEWVQRHISKFGGDPSRVTIWGESAGAGSVIQHVIANDGNTQPPLFRAAMTSSTYLPPQYAFNDRIPEQVFHDVVDQSGCSSAPDALECLRQVDVSTLNKVNLNVTGNQFFGTCILVPVVDGKLITKRPTELLRKGRLNGDALLAVTNTFEGTPFVDSNTAGTVTTPEYLGNLFPELTKDQVDAGAAQYAALGAPIDQARAIMAEAIFICPTYFLLHAFKNKSFKGEFAIPPALHGDDVLYYFTHAIVQVSTPWNNPEFVKNFGQSFMNFVLAMDPNIKWDSSNTLPQWPRWTEDGRAETVFNKTEADVPVFRSVQADAGLLSRCDFWESVSASTAQ
ncbi:hypothetical protein D9756_005140 [Leucocoprinus leucothites]|uniref:Carboxylic ester hydrolase n=1 Tax=Leucocoprinus leucothites TaxID=201217 RepID=A0A8H5LL03_9AGAR|nr:hypothetical protein D9756_005140 [Leucoagaricus leucothites]